MAVQALKGAPYGPVRLGIAKPVVEDSVEVSSSAANNNEGAQTVSNNDYEEVWSPFGHFISFWNEHRTTPPLFLEFN